VTPSAADTAARLDKWLWAVRIFKSRALATDACRAGSVCIRDEPAKPARNVRPGEIVTVRQGIITRTLQVVGAPRSRVSAKLVTEFCIDLTPAAEFEKARLHRVQQVLAREKRQRPADEARPAVAGPIV